MIPIKNFINRLDKELDDVWKSDAKTAFTNIQAEKDESKRASLINDYSAIWGRTKPKLSKFLNDKCWYCETQVIRDDGAIDHHRPKNQVKDYPSCQVVKNHPGYWWLAFEPRTFRFCCKFCNETRRDKETNFSGGKSSFFPVFDETRRLSSLCRYEELEDETAILIDPTKSADVGLLTFDRDGKVLPRVNDNEWNRRRVETSRDVYNLDHSLLVKARAVVDRDVAFKVADAQRHFNRLSKNPSDVSAQDGYSTAYRDLENMIDILSPYSMQARATLRTFRDYPWVSGLLN